MQSRAWKTKMSGNDRAELMDLYQRHNKNGSCFSIRHVGNVIMKVKQALQKANIAAPSHSPISAAGSQDLTCAPYSAYGFNFETSEPSTSFSPWQTNVIAVR